MAVGPISCESLTSTIYTLSVFKHTFYSPFILYLHVLTFLLGYVHLSESSDVYFELGTFKKKIDMNRSQIP